MAAAAARGGGEVEHENGCTKENKNVCGNGLFFKKIYINILFGGIL